MPRPLLLLALLILPVSAAPSKLSAEGLKKIGAAFENDVKAGNIAGAVVAIVHHEELVYFEVFGEQSPGVPMRRDTIFRIYSMSKPITAVATMILVEEGKLKLDDPITKYLPALAKLKVHKKSEYGGKPARPATIRDLLCHTAGFSYGFGMGAVDAAYRKDSPLKAKDLAAMIEKLAELPLVGEPGARWHYSVANDVLGRIVEVVSKQSFEEFLSARVFSPLKMRDTRFSVTKDKLDRFATNYAPKRGGGLRVLDAPATSKFAGDVTFYSGGGGLVSTARDYLFFCMMLARGGEWAGERILKAETVSAMTSNQLPASLVPIRFGAFPMPGTGFGFGVSVRVAKEPAARLGEWGWGGAASTVFSVAPAEDLIVLTMTQLMPMKSTFHARAKKLAYEALVSD